MVVGMVNVELLARAAEYCSVPLSLIINMIKMNLLLSFFNQYAAASNRGDRPFVMLSLYDCLLYTSPSPRDQRGSRMPSSA